MIKDELLAKEPVNGTDEKESVGRVVRVENVEPFGGRDVQAPKETRSREITILREVSDDRLQLCEERARPRGGRRRELLEECQSRNPVHGNAVHDFTGGLGAPPKGYDADTKA